MQNDDALNLINREKHWYTSHLYTDYSTNYLKLIKFEKKIINLGVKKISKQKRKKLNSLIKSSQKEQCFAEREGFYLSIILINFSNNEKS